MKRPQPHPVPLPARARRGVVVPLVAVLLPVLLILLGFAVDLAYMQNTRTELRLATDSAVRAAATELSRSDNQASARAAAKRIANANTVAGAPLTLRDAQIVFGRNDSQANGRFAFVPGATPVNAVRVTGDRSAGSAEGDVPLFFGGLVGRPSFGPQVTSVSGFANFDICLVLDRSSSMKLDIDDPNQVLQISNPRVCQPPLPTSRWVALDRAVSIFSFLLGVSPASEQVSLVTYSSDISNESWKDMCGAPHRSERAALIDLPLTTDLDALTNEIDAWSNSLFNGNTHIEEGIRFGIRALGGPNARDAAEKVIIVLTDGHQNVGDARDAARDAANQEITVHALTFSNDADRALMAEVADIGGGVHLHANTALELIQVFKRVAGEVARITE